MNRTLFWFRLFSVSNNLRCYCSSASKNPIFKTNRKKKIDDLHPLSVSQGVTKGKGRNPEKHFGSREPKRRRDNPGLDQYFQAMGISTKKDLESLCSSEHFDFEDATFEETAVNEPEIMMNRVHEDIKNIDRAIWYKKVKKEYFREPPEPCLLTWAAKQQIRFLYDLNPEEWTPEKLAESFPISVNGVKKLLKSTFVSASEETIRKHDQKVIKRWENLKNNTDTNFVSPVIRKLWLEGKLSPEHAYGNKTLPVPTRDYFNKQYTLRKPTKQEFVNLVKTYLNLKGKTTSSKDGSEDVEKNESIHAEILHDDVLSATYLDCEGYKSGKNMTFEQFKHKNAENLNLTKAATNVSHSHANWNQEVQMDGGSSASEIIDELKVEKYLKDPTDESTTMDDGIYGKYGYSGSPGTSDSIREKIKIPKSKLKQCKEFRYGDCIYDEDGEFLYRVPV